MATELQIRVLQFLDGKGYVSPTTIGNVVWGPSKHSSTASPVCLSMVKDGLLKRNSKGWYKIKRLPGIGKGK